MCDVSVTHRETLSPRDVFEARQRFATRLQEAGYLPTDQRSAIIEAMLHTDGHICAEHILDSVKHEHPSLRVNKTTVYRALDLFLSLGLIREIKFADGRAQYELAMRGSHSHLLCQRCGSLTELNADVAATMRHSLSRHHGFTVDLEGYPLFGVCESCRGH